MLRIDYTVSENQLQELFLLSKEAFNNITYLDWCNDLRTSYYKYALENRMERYTFAEWVRNQIIVLNQLNY